MRGGRCGRRELKSVFIEPAVVHSTSLQVADAGSDPHSHFAGEAGVLIRPIQCALSLPLTRPLYAMLRSRGKLLKAALAY